MSCPRGDLPWEDPNCTQLSDACCFCNVLLSNKQTTQDPPHATQKTSGHTNRAIRLTVSCFILIAFQEQMFFVGVAVPSSEGTSAIWIVEPTSWRQFSSAARFGRIVNNRIWIHLNIERCRNCSLCLKVSNNNTNKVSMRQLYIVFWKPGGGGVSQSGTNPPAALFQKTFF